VVQDKLREFSLPVLMNIEDGGAKQSSVFHFFPWTHGSMQAAE